MSIPIDKKSTRGRPVADTELVTARVARPVLAALDHWAADQPNPKPSRPEAVRRALADHLRAKGYLPATSEPAR